jgi:hypothetical protein
MVYGGYPEPWIIDLYEWDLDDEDDDDYFGYFDEDDDAEEEEEEDEEAEPTDVVLPDELKALRELEQNLRRTPGLYVARDKSFFEEAKSVEDFECVYEGTGATMRFGYGRPSYMTMTDYQLLKYFDFRTRFRHGESPDGPVPFFRVLAFELIDGIGAKDAMDGYEQLCRLRDLAAPKRMLNSMDITGWINDYVLNWDLDPRLLEERALSERYMDIVRLMDAESVLLGLPVCAWPQYAAPHPAGLPDATDLFDALGACSSYQAEKSRFFRDRREDAAEVACRVFARMVDHCHKRRKKDYVQGLLGESSYMVYRVFPNSLFYSPRPHEDVEVKLGSETYKCERGFWYRELPVKVSDTSKELGNLLHTIDVRMRIAAGYPHLLKERTISKFQSKFIDEEIEAFIAERAAVEAATIRIDRFALDDIRTSSVRTREALLTDEERDDVLGALGPEAIHEAEEVSEPAPPVTHDSEPAVEVAEVAAPDSSDLPLTPVQLDILRKLLSGETVSEGAGPFLSLEIDAINECFLDIVGDTVIEYADDGYELVEDYVHDVREALG